MSRIPRIRAFLPTRFNGAPPHLPAPTRAGEAPDVFRTFARTLEKLERRAVTRKPDGEGG
ncbi:hypothetical protein MWN34_05445 [Ancylobacter sp. 6x-1]|uniref:Uncharacterized protein n=1 Tax=Ancylobacter crimeensis TaxID=2579147 RepID=A0ABT0D8T9_9HYPH|nr:hypothetical protein [Ancylobacter crimeensis]MCK0196355.1 hypothetical protein [Ancylobacter crimeensis]